ncbi:zinc finger protein 771-like [Labrus mixtus]|uniref:zinc finger protein 771-like n=1 Tax=Labrus mixtus TaxID=508554 RepID=UPI0029C06B54|nr:zinc finger protein 771-like [Labrus mixtus]
MADNEHLPRLLVTARPAKNSEKRKTEAEKAATKSSGQNRVNIGTAFQRWRQLRELKGLRSDSMVALFLLDSYEKQTSTPWKPGLLRPPPPAGSAVPAESLSDHDGDLSVAPEHTLELLKKTAEYEEELRHLKEENERQQKLLDAAFNSEVRLHRAGVEQLMVRREEVPSEQQEGSSGLNHEDQTEPPHSKGEQLQDPEEAEIIKFTFFPVPVKTEEDDEEKPQSSQFQQTQTDQIRDEYLKAEAKGEESEGSDPTTDFNPDSHLQPVSDEEASHSSDTDDSGDWDASEPHEGLNPLQNKDTPVSDVNCDTGNTSVSSSECATSFGQEEHLQQHKEILTGEKPFSCSVCGKRYPSKKNLHQHMRRHSVEKPFSCSVCQRSFNWKTELVTHMRIHTGEKPFSCSVCGQGFRDRGCLKRHFFVHTGEKPFSCSVCGKSFTQSGDLQRHSVVHTGEKLFSCLICGYRCTHGGDLNRHSVVHTGEKPFSCSVCGKRFTQSGALKRHSISHTLETPFTCTFCDRTFTELESVKNHNCESQMA